jgi:hypothetical protein
MEQICQKEGRKGGREGGRERKRKERKIGPGMVVGTYNPNTQETEARGPPT